MEDQRTKKIVLAIVQNMDLVCARVVNDAKYPFFKKLRLIYHEKTTRFNNTEV